MRSIQVELILRQKPPLMFGDLFFVLRGFENSDSPASGIYISHQLNQLDFDQVDDYWGIRAHENSKAGNEVVVWLSPLVKGQDVYHHHGPFDGLRLDYSVIRNDATHKAIFLKAITALRDAFNASLQMDGSAISLAVIDKTIDEAILEWAARGIIVGSDEALQIPS